jgi:hypothetical protein
MKTSKETLVDRFILVAMSSEILAQSLLGNNIHVRELARKVDSIVNISNNQLYADIIEGLRDSEIMNYRTELIDEENPLELTSDEEWFDMIQDLLQQVKTNIQ